MPTLDERYPDLLAPRADADTVRFVADLDTACAQSTPPAHLRGSIAQALKERATVPRPAAARRRGGLQRCKRPAFVAAALLAALVAGIVSASGDPPSLTDQAMVYAPDQRPVMQRYGHAIDVAGYACGYTLRVTRVYADANRISILYTLSGPPGRHFVSMGAGRPTLIDVQRRHTPVRNLDLGASRDTIGTTQGLYAAFDAHTIAGNAQALRLRFTLPEPTMDEQIGIFGWGAATASCESYQPGGDYGNGLLPFLTATHTRLVLVHRPLTVAFTVPVDPARRVVVPRQTVVAAGTGLVIDRVVVTHSEARVYLRRTTPGHILENVNVDLSVDGRQYSAAPLFGDYWVRVAPATRLYDFSVAGPPYSYRGEWTLTVQPIPLDSYMTASWRRPGGGPWTFHFLLPPTVRGGAAQ